MKHSYDDDRLEEKFGRLRSETEGSPRVPDFRAMLEKAKVAAAERPDLQVIQGGQADPGQSDAGSRRRRVMQIGGWASAAVAAAVAGVLLTGGPSDADREFERLVASYTTDLSAGAWRSPTAALMNVPGMNLTRSVPSFGITIRGLDPSQLPNVPERETRDL